MPERAMGTAEERTEERVIHFGGFTLDLKRHGLYRGQERIHLTAKPLETLIFLVENRGRVIGKQELLDAVWKDTFVTEDTLVHAVRQVRRALEDDKEDPRFIQTVPRQGYRFVGDVTVTAPVAVLRQPDASRPPQLLAGPTQKLPRWLWVTAIFFVAVPISLWVFWPSNQKREGQNYARRPGQLKEVTGGEFASIKPAFSPDGKLIVYVSSSEETRGYGDLFVRPAAEGNPLRITNKINPSGDLPVFTANGDYIVFSLPRVEENSTRTYDLWMVPASGGPLKRFIKDASGAGFSPDGGWVVYTKHLRSGNALWISPVDHLESHLVVNAEGYTPRWSPGGEWLAYTTSNPNGGVGDIWVVRVSRSDDGQPALSGMRPVTHERKQMYGLTWAADGRSIIFASRRTGPLQLYDVSLANGTVSLLQGGLGDYEAPSASPDGSSVIFSQKHLTNDLMLARPGLPCDAQPLTYNQFHLWPRVSPSGEKLASVVRQIENAERLYITDLKTRGRIRLSERAAHHPCWLNDETVAFLSPDGSGQNTEACAVNIVTREISVLTRFPGQADWLAVYPGAERLAVVLKSPEGSQRIVLRDLSNQNDTAVHSGSKYEHLRWSPDGLALSWNQPGASQDSASGGVWVMEIGGAGPRLLVKDAYGPLWSEDGATVYFARREGQTGLWKYEMRQDRQHQVCSWKLVYTYDLVGNRLVFAQNRNNSQVYSIGLR